MNDEDFKNIVERYADECAAIVIEPARNTLVSKKFLSEIRKLANKNGCVLIFDEITCAWRNDTSGIHKELGINPDLAAFGKTMANGIPMAALIGKKPIMQNATQSFISSTNWTERLGPACSLTFIEKHRKLKLGNILKNNGKKIRKIWQNAADNSKLKISISGILPLSSFKIEDKQWPIIITYFIQEMLNKKILASDRCYSNYCHSSKNLKFYETACNEVFLNIRKYLTKN